MKSGASWYTPYIHIWEFYNNIFSSNTFALIKSRGKACNNFARFLGTPFSRSETWCIEDFSTISLQSMGKEWTLECWLSFVRSQEETLAFSERGPNGNVIKIFSRAWSLFLSRSSFRIDRKRDTVSSFSPGARTCVTNTWTGGMNDKYTFL